eukprot:CAMPEP_0174370938 /NCGR_PEP_ID=MMETSP0811_2-20130205/97944_1 /TAXON_ID=73025 ORGANISM="Eutreptiella gymnastica-like, Strain CCMP1594" /NCGR_SAMPLE_ID=MMETSP0811_2 /ASSEMBLY_ACC=CAM_ASM_000667 /LENGTH=120 /DNA_ID=CAMNT_0015516849 /DNA_START=184 /DNA_END=546 /DNA_ORIENTATION=+
MGKEYTRQWLCLEHQRWLEGPRAVAARAEAGPRAGRTWSMPRVEVPGAPADLADRGSSLRGASIPTSPPDLRRQFSAMLDLRGSSLAVPAAEGATSAPRARTADSATMDCLVLGLAAGAT